MAKRPSVRGRSSKHLARLTSQIERSLSLLLQSHPVAGIAVLDIVHTRLSSDGLYADLFCNLWLQDELQQGANLSLEKMQAGIAKLNDQSSHLRMLLASKLQTKRVPTLRFHANEMALEQAKIDHLFEQDKR